MELYLVSKDYIDFEKPTKIISYNKSSILGRNCLIVELEEGLDFSEFGFSKQESKFILVDRHFYNRLHNLQDFPIEVHVFIPLDYDNPTKGFKSWDELFNVAWANLYNDYNTARLNKG